MKNDVIFFGWNRSIPGREHLSKNHFEEFNHYLAGLQQENAISSFDVVILDSHGGDLNGFFLIRGDTTKLDAILKSERWRTHLVRAALHLEGSGAVRGVTGDQVMERMRIWSNNIPA